MNLKIFISVMSNHVVFLGYGCQCTKESNKDFEGHLYCSAGLSQNNGNMREDDP